MNISEEKLIFNAELGKAIAQWGHVERQLLQLVMVYTRPCKNGVAEAYLAVENFRSKLAFCDRLVRGTSTDAAALQYWLEIQDACAKAATKRNQLAHGWHELYVHQTTGKHFAISPVTDKTGKLLHRSGKSAPQGTIYMQDIVLYRLEFRRLTAQICNLVELVSGNPKPFPDADRPNSKPPTLRMLEERFRLEVGRKPRPPRKPKKRAQQPADLIEPPSVSDPLSAA